MTAPDLRALAGGGYAGLATEGPIPDADALRAEADRLAAERPARLARWRALLLEFGIPETAAKGTKYLREEAIADAGLVAIFDERERNVRET